MSVEKTWHKRIAKITSTMLGFEDHGIFTAVLHVDYGGSSQGLGCFAMGGKGWRDEKPTAHILSGEFIVRVLKACGVDTWEQLNGRTIHVLFDEDSWNATPRGIENLPTEDGERFVFAEWQERAKEAHDARRPYDPVRIAEVINEWREWKKGCPL